MADLGPKKISTNYQKLLQTSDGGIVQDGSGSAIPNLNITGNISASGTISASIIYADTMYTSGSSLYIGHPGDEGGRQHFTAANITTLKAGKSLGATPIGKSSPTLNAGIGNFETIS